MPNITTYNRSYSVSFLRRKEWVEIEPDLLGAGVCWFTYGSRTVDDIGRRIFMFEPRAEGLISVGKLTDISNLNKSHTGL